MATITTTIMTMSIEERAHPLDLDVHPEGDGADRNARDGVRPRPQAEGQVEEVLALPQALLKLQSWLSPAFPIGAYSYSHGLEWAVEAGRVRDRASLVDWLDADLRLGTGRNEGIFFCEAWRRCKKGDPDALLDLAEQAAAFRGTLEFALEASQQGAACLATLRKAWPEPRLDELAASLSKRAIAPTAALCLGAACAAHGLPLELSLPLYLQSVVSNLVTAGVRLIPLGQTDGQRAVAALEGAVSAASAAALSASLDDLGSAAFMIDLASMAHETQYTRLFRS